MSAARMLGGLLAVLSIAAFGTGNVVAGAGAAPAKGAATVAKHGQKKHAKKQHAKKKHAKKEHAKKKHHAKKRHAHKKQGGRHKHGHKGAGPQPLGVGPTEKGGTKAIESPSEIPVAPAWTEEQLNAEPSGNWITSEGGTTGDHFSRLTEITPANVSGLKSDWMTQLEGSGEALKYTGEAPPVEYKGVIYYVTGADDVFAVSVASGKILWATAAELPETVNAVCCNWDNRGVTIAEGKVFTAILSGSVEALDQKTGQVVWRTELGEPSEGLTVTSAPLYYNGMIFIGPVGSEYGVRGWMAAYSAKTGALIWKHYNIPAPGEPGAESWPHNTTCQECNAAWQHGGATTWNAPTVDDKTGLIYYSTANAGADYQGATRAGEDLWTVSMLALNYKTGEQAWGYQEVHHDIWDYDASAQPTMINVKINGKTVEGIVQTDKDGFAYFVDAATGEPVFPIEEKPVPQDTQYEATYPTQPIPTMPAFDPLKATPAMIQEIQSGVDESAAGKHVPPPTVEVNSGYEGLNVFSPIGIIGEPTIQISSNGGGGDQEAPDAYNPKTGMLYVCSHLSIAATSITPVNQKWEEGQDYTGTSGLSGGISYETMPGYITAYDMHTGKIAWEDTLPQPCYQGEMVTQGGVLFSEDWTDDLIAYEASTGKELWSFGIGAQGSPATAFEWKGHEYISDYAGGAHHSTAPRADNLWLFSLNGSGQAAPIALGQTPAPETRIKG